MSAERKVYATTTLDGSQPKTGRHFEAAATKASKQGLGGPMTVVV